MLHLAAFTALIDNTANTVVTPLQDDILTIANNRFQMPFDCQLLLGCVMAATLNRARLNYAQLRAVTPEYLRPIEAAVIPSDLPSVAEFWDRPFNFPLAAQLALEATSDVAMGTERFTGLIWLSTGIDPVPVGDVYWARFTSTTAAVANAWTSLAITLEQDLPPGRWWLVGSELQSTNAIAHRWILPGQVWRPGSLSITALGNQTHPAFYNRRLGIYGSFQSDLLPTCQVLANAANAAHTGWMQLVRAA